jgi:antitoxin Phd
MPISSPTRTVRKVRPARSIATLGQWKLEDAKARLSEVVRLASSEGPQLVTVRGKEAAIVLDPETYRQLLPQTKEQPSLVSFLQGLDLSRIDIERENDPGREIDL